MLDSIPLVLTWTEIGGSPCSVAPLLFGAVNLEDIAAPASSGKKSSSKPSPNDDQHGTAVVVLAALNCVRQLTAVDETAW